MRILNIYSKYKIPPNLQLHMMRVAAVGNIIASNWKQKGIVNINRITETLLLHDMANIIIFDFDKNPHLLGNEEKNLEYWKSVQKEFIKKYGTDEHQAVSQIVHEIGLEEKAINILIKMPEINSENQIEKEDWEFKICWYADFRVAPYGVTDIDDRLNDLITRRKAKGVSKDKIQELEKLRNYCHSLEKEIQKNIFFNLKSLNENSIEKKKNKLLKISIERKI